MINQQEKKSMKLVKIIVVLLWWACASTNTNAQEIKAIKYSALNEIITSKTSQYKVINFWATWCKPCIKELPQFEALNKKHRENGLEVILVSFDFAEDLEKRLIPYVNKKNIKSKVLLLDETDYNSFIDKIDPSWSGAIPATLMMDYRNGNKQFFEQEFKEGELEKVYLEFIN